MTLIPGTPAPLFIAPSPLNPNFAFGSLGGRYVLLVFLPGPGPERDAAVRLAREHRHLFHDERLVLFGVLPDADSCAAARKEAPWQWFADPQGHLRRLYQVVGPQGEVEPHWVLIDPMLRVMGSAPLPLGAAVMANLAKAGSPDAHAGVPLHAPTLIVPRIFEPELCRKLIDYYQAAGGVASGVMREIDGKTVGVLDDFKKRRDASIEDADLITQTRARINLRLRPQIKKAFQFDATCIERFIVARYDADEGGYFQPHRDNTTPGTAHRKFAVSINLNAEEFEGGDLRFPEFGQRTYRPPTGGAVVFSCSLLHEATPVTRGVRYAFLPFLYDEDGARVRAENMHTFQDQPSAAAFT